MRLTTLYRIPRGLLKSIEPDQDYLDQFPCCEIDGVASGYWPLLAAKLKLSLIASGDALPFDEQGGMAMIEWSPEFARGLCQTPKATLASAVEELDQADAYPGHETSTILEAVEQLRHFFSETDCDRDALVEYATF